MEKYQKKIYYTWLMAYYNTRYSDAFQLTQYYIVSSWKFYFESQKPSRTFGIICFRVNFIEIEFIKIRMT